MHLCVEGCRRLVCAPSIILHARLLRAPKAVTVLIQVLGIIPDCDSNQTPAHQAPSSLCPSACRCTHSVTQSRCDTL